MTFKKAIGKIHLWLGLASGLVIIIIATTGCIISFEDEIRSLFFKQSVDLKEDIRTPKMSLSSLKEIAEQELNNQYKINRVIIDFSKNKAYAFRTLKINEEALTYWGYYQYYYMVYVNPYTGKVIAIENKNNFFSIVLGLHTHLLLGEKIGKQISGYSTLLFFVSLFSGLFLWLPKKRTFKNISKRLKLKYTTNVKRLTYDLHNVLGFYVLIPLLMVSFTGLIWTFKNVDYYTQYTLNGFKAIEKAELPKSKIPKNKSLVTATPDIAFNYVQTNFPKTDRLYINFPKKTDAPLTIFAYTDKVFYKSNQILFDQYSGNVIKTISYKDKNASEKFRNMIYDLHTGSFLGITGRLLVFIASLLAISLPITGFMIYLNKNK